MHPFRIPLYYFKHPVPGLHQYCKAILSHPGMAFFKRRNLTFLTFRNSFFMSTDDLHDTIRIQQTFTRDII
ncbi:MAG: hypothetical protein EA363_12860 [Balneolaceae bacterium]|nr:MAG: hypothetical protein EA363_12860 [Balneolaceae bacterium]